MKKVLLSLALIGAVSLQAKTYATIGDKKITDVDVNQVLRIIPEGKMILQFGGIDKLDKKKQKQIVDIAVDNYLLSKKALSEGIDKTYEYKQKLENIKSSLLTQIYTTKIISKVKVSDKDVKEYYEKNKDQFKEPEDKVKARHILVNSEKEAQKIIDELKKAKNVTAKFIELAKKKSIGPSKADGGNLGWFDAKRMVPEFSKASFALKKGEFTKKPVKTQFGYHVILVEGKIKKGTLTPFASVKEKIKQVVKNQKIKANIDDIIKKQREKNKVSYK